MQERALETRKKIITSALKLYATKGYNNTTVDEIAADAGVSTGIAYRYFKNKKDLLLSALSFAFGNIQNISSTTKIDFSAFGNIEQMLDYALTQFEKLHQENFALHEELEALRHSDKDVKAFYSQVEESAILKLLPELKAIFPDVENLQEKVIIAISLMENYCHLSCQAKFPEENLKIIKKLTVQQVLNCLN